MVQEPAAGVPFAERPPHPRLEKAYAEGHEMRFWVRYPTREPGGAIRWTRTRTVLQRYLGQIEIVWGKGQDRVGAAIHHVRERLPLGCVSEILGDSRLKVGRCLGGRVHGHSVADNSMWRRRNRRSLKHGEAAMPVTCTLMLRRAAFGLVLLAPALGFAADPVAKTDGETAGLRVEVIELKRSSGDTLTLRFNLINDSAESFKPGGWYFGDYKGHQNQDIGNVGAITLIDTVGRKKYFVVRDTDQNCVCSNGLPSVNAKSRAALWAKFPAPPGDVKKIGVVIPHFIPMDDVPISQ